MEKLVRAYAAYAHAEDDSAEQRENFWAFTQFNLLASLDPAATWETVKQLLSFDCSDRVLELVAAGPVEELFLNHGSRVIAAVEKDAAENKVIADMLGGVWKSDIDQDVWRRVEVARSRKW